MGTGPSGGQRVLVVDDEPMVREVVATYLQRDGLQVHEAGDGPAAEEWLRTHRPDLVVLDIMLPGTDGLTILRRLRDQGEIPVILLTARAEEVDRVLGLELGADDYVVKPFSPRELAARVRTVLRRSDPAAPTTTDVLEFRALQIDAGTREVHVDGRPVTLTAKEFDLLLALGVRAAVGVLAVTAVFATLLVLIASRPLERDARRLEATVRSIEAGERTVRTGLDLVREPIDLSELIDEAVEALTPAVAAAR